MHDHGLAIAEDWRNEKLPAAAVVLCVQLVPALDDALPSAADTAFTIVGITVQVPNAVIVGVTKRTMPATILCVPADVWCAV